MGTFLSLCYTAVDTICLILFLDVFEQRRFDGLKFHLHVLEYVLLSCWIPLILSIIVGHNQALKILIILLIDFIIAKRLYTEISTAILCFFVSLEYLLSYCLSFTVGMTCSVIFGMDSNTFQASPICVIIYGIIAYSLQLFSLGQQLEVQVRSMESASKLFSEQRKKVHDYRSHLNTLRVLLQNHEYEQAEVYLNSVSKQQTERLFLVNTHHSILDALFNTKASEAIQEGIEIDFRVNDLSMLPFEAADMVVLLSNLLDNAIEANRSYCGSKKIHVTALWKKSFLFSIRNTSNPVRIENNTIQTTKPDPQLHGFGLSNVKLILEKYNGDFTMDYEDNWFQFTGEISQ